MPFNDPGNRLVLRPVVESDADFLYTLYASTRADEMAMLDWSEQQKQDFLQMQFRAQSTYYREQYADASFDVIELEGVPVGRLYINKDEGEVRVIDIALLPEYREQGIGGYFMRSIIDSARADGSQVTIHVEHNNPAMSLYRRLGFVREEDKGVYWFMRWRDTDDQEKTAS